MKRDREEEKAIEEAIRSGKASPLTRFRVTLLCDCFADASYGYGPSVEKAEARAWAAFRRHNRGRPRRAKVAERIVEEAVGSHYEPTEEER